MMRVIKSSETSLHMMLDYERTTLEGVVGPLTDEGIVEA